jgi:hypothetical protein
LSCFVGVKSPMTWHRGRDGVVMVASYH